MLLTSEFTILADQKMQASSYPEWLDTATRLDQIEGNDIWKANPDSDSYNFRLLQDRLRQLREAKEDHDVAQMLFLVRTTFSRNTSGMGNLDVPPKFLL